ncbi:uncharacterized protein UV8b_02792 [Ustilaginoidea virens]|uniref:Uncharacterized protein n=1 Tax=Ustilaginoidea virens TaxID=1159556 RepID=A0A063BR69_USTVR|nr:uncharacterized protein UV8b_02792 [Ustilaginoidea virens]QUC18551.1 hypothetical protein UV8b_02792 [Ustilaginoidea virens]GAO19751.1 hypothetical protein UVI_02030530 [Ustilaginoidea virens]
MAPVRRYLRISKYSVLECRIYLDNPSLAQSWLLNPVKPVLPRIIECVRPLVLPKLREERERSNKKSSKKRSVKDVIVREDFEVSVFLTETSTRHSLLTKQKHFREKGPGLMQSNSAKLIRETNHVPVDVDRVQTEALVIREENGEEDDVQLSEIPPASAQKRRRGHGKNQDSDSDAHAPDTNREQDGHIDLDADGDERRPKRPRVPDVLENDDSLDEEDDKKKLTMDVSYQGFAIYGRVLCLVVRKTGNKTRPNQQNANAASGGQASMENWITSTQIPMGQESE